MSLASTSRTSWRSTRIRVARVLEVRRGGQRVRARGRCVGAARKSERIKCAWAGAGACARSRCAPGGGAASASGRARPRAGARGRRSKEGCVRELFARPASPGRGRRSEGLPPAAGPERPPRPHFRLPPLPRSRLPGPPVPREPRRLSPTRPALLAPTPPPPLVGSASSEPAGRGRCSTYGRVNNCLAPGLRSAAPGGQSLQPGADMDPNPRAALERQQLRLRERQKFFEDILQPETEFVFPLSHLHLESHRPPIGSISSMEVNVDTLEQVEFIDLGDQDGADVFLPCEDSPPAPHVSGVDNHPEELSLPVPTPDRTTSRTSSLSSDSSNLRSPNPSDGGADTPLAQSDDENGDDGGAESGQCS